MLELELGLAACADVRTTERYAAFRGRPRVERHGERVRCRAGEAPIEGSNEAGVSRLAEVQLLQAGPAGSWVLIFESPATLPGNGMASPVAATRIMKRRFMGSVARYPFRFISFLQVPGIFEMLFDEALARSCAAAGGFPHATARRRKDRVTVCPSAWVFL